MAVAKGTQISGSWQAVYDLLTDSSKGLSDPKSRSLDKDDWIFSSYPDIKGDDFPGFPIVAIQSPNYTNSRFTLEYRESNITIMFTIVSDNLEDLDDLTDDVIETLMSNKDETIGDGLRSGSVINSSTSTDMLEGQKKVHQKNLFVQYKWWGAF